MSNTSSLISLLEAQRDACIATRHRQLVVIAGEQNWSYQQLAERLPTLTGEWCWIGDHAPCEVRQVATQQANTLLGGEWQGVVYNAYTGFDPDAFGAVAGTLTAGGLLLLLTPPLDSWREFPDPHRLALAVFPYAEEEVTGRYLGRLSLLFRQSNNVLLIVQGKALPEIIAMTPPPMVAATTNGEWASADQQLAVDGLCRVAQGHRRRPLVMVSDRGRGKTTALGLAAARLLQQGMRRIVVTAPRLAAVTPLFEHATKRLEGATYSRGSLKLANGAELLFEPPDRVVHETIPCELLLVDEAAAIPASLLERMLRKHSRIAFATTVHGYEGTGRGFDLRFRKVLDALTPQWRSLRLQQPIRWAENDPLEQMVFRSLLLDAEPADDVAVENIALQQCVIERLDRDALANDEALLSQLFGLLVLAHYRTSPSDLRNLLDAPNLQVVVLRHQNSILATALLATEGGFDQTLSHQVYEGKRRLRGNLLPQSLTVHTGVAEAAVLCGIRVMRIAVHPSRQGEGFGSHLIDGVMALAGEAGADYVGASFGATTELLDFWERQHCHTVRIGLQREASSGLHAAMVLRPLSEKGEALFAETRQRFVRQLPLLLSEPLCELESELIERLLPAGDNAFPLLDAMQWADVKSFAFAQRDYGNCLAALHALLLVSLTNRQALKSLSTLQRAVMIKKVLQRHSWQSLSHRYGLQGRGEVVQLLREGYASLCEYYAIS